MDALSKTLLEGQEATYEIYDIKKWGELHQILEKGLVTDYKTFWDEVHTHKYDTDLFLGDAGSSEFVFRLIELPVIKVLYPPEMVNPKVKSLLSFYLKKATTAKPHSFAKYLELRKKGMLPQEARKRLGMENGIKSFDTMIENYGRPFRYKYELSSEDADTLYRLGINLFIKNFYDRFYVPVQSVPSRNKRA